MLTNSTREKFQTNTTNNFTSHNRRDSVCWFIGIAGMRMEHTSSILVSASRNGIKSAAPYHYGRRTTTMGTAFSGWKRYDVGELSTIMVSFNSRPRRDKSYTVRQTTYGNANDEWKQEEHNHVLSRRTFT